MKIDFKLFILFVGLTFCASCKKQEVVRESAPEGELLMTIALGSCNRENQEQIMWDDILEDVPDYWIWLGDNVYGDTNDTLIMKEKYERQKSNEMYQELRSKAGIYGIWDDHDYGKNDAGKEFSEKRHMRDLMFEFLDVPKDNVSWGREGGYQSYLLTMNNVKVKLILLDSRYFRDDPIKQGNGYAANLDGTILGEEQWEWFENEIDSSEADIHLIGNGIQVISAEHNFEKWNNFPNERQRLLDLIQENSLKNTIILSGDRHLSELSKFKEEGQDQPIYDITSSGMTHSYTSYSGEPNQFRIGEVVASKSYAVVKVFKNTEGDLGIRLYFKGDEGKLYQEFKLF